MLALPYLRGLRSCQRTYQTHAHPQLFRQTIQLTDGSTVKIASVSSQRPFIKLGIDSLSHPTWNPTLRNKLFLSENAEVAKFKDRYSGTANESLMQEFDGLLGNLLKDTTSSNKKKVTKATTSLPNKKKK